MTRMITIKRASAFSGCLVPVTISVDGRAVGEVKNGASQSFAIDERAHALSAALKKYTPGQAALPAGYGDVVFTLSVQPGFPCNRLELRPEPSQASVPARNGLDDYRAGGRRHTVRTMGQGPSSYEQLEAWLISNTLGNIFSGMLVPDWPPIVEYTRKTGVRPRAARLVFSLREGACRYDCTFYASPSCAPESKIVTIPNDDSFDFLISDREHQRRCVCPQHDLTYIRGLLLTDVAQKCPRARLQGNALSVVLG